jgi:chromate reductase
MVYNHFKEQSMYKIAVFVGSLRRESINRILAKALAKLGQKQFAFHFVELGDIPIYNQDLEASLPASVARMKQEILAADGILFVTPEYNRSIPAVLKNAIDWGTRPWGQNSWVGKPASIVGATPGTVGTAAAQAHLRSILPIFDMKVMGQPEVYFVFKPEMFDAEHNILDDKTRDFLQNYLIRLAAWMEQSLKN